MTKRTLITLYRSQKKQKLVSLINIIGLAVALSCLSLTIIFLKNELSYDRWNPRINNLYRLTRSYLSKDGTPSMHLGHISSPFAPSLKENFEEIQMIGRIVQYETRLSLDTTVRQNYIEKNVFMVDPEILQLFSVNLTKGNSQKALNEPFKIILSEDMAKKLFSNQNPMGQKLLSKDKLLLEVTGVFETFRKNSHWHPDYLISFSTLNDNSVYGRKNIENNWENDSFATYFLSSENLNINGLERNINSFIDNSLGSIMPKGFSKPSKWTKLHIQKVKDIHLKSNLDSEFESNGNLPSLYLIGTISILILFLAVFNYTNLSIGRASERLKEIGVKKIHGALKSELIWQFVIEAILIALFSLILALILSLSVSSWINSTIYSNISPVDLLRLDTLIIMLLITVIIGVVAGIYPAVLISLFKPIDLIRGQLVTSQAKFIIRKILTVLQFGISIALIILTVHISGQLNFIDNYQLGYDKNNIIILPYYDELSDHYEAFYNTLTGNSQIKDITRSSRFPTERLIDVMDASFEEGDTLMPTRVKIKYVCVDHKFFETYKVPFNEGRDFSLSIQSDITEGFVLNEEAVKAIGWKSSKEAIGKKIEYGYVSGRVIGVVKNFHFESLHQVINPTIFFISEYPLFINISLKINGDPKDAVPFIQKTWTEYMPNFPFEFRFLNEQYENQYKNESIELKVLKFLTILSIALSTIGLLGLTISSTNQKIKEVSIRKIHGATLSNITFFITKEPFLLLIISSVIAIPASWFALNKWLENFPYKIDISVYVFVSAVFFVLGLSLIIVVIQAWKVIIVNPAKILRHE
jgi:putative ABC transport system permease protein